MNSYDTPELIVALKAMSERDYREAFRLLSQLADADNPKAQCNLATCYHLGLGVEADGAKAVDLYTRVAEQNIRDEHLSAIAYNNMASIYVVGLPGIETDHQKAVEYRKKSDALGFPMRVD
ncbi:MAG TPA: hypothetical protein VN176_17590 [Verrucomicrobiae bacterium]|nr:hypothetical protein [Verrucomicrobiae bacterium]